MVLRTSFGDQQRRPNPRNNNKKQVTSLPWGAPASPDRARLEHPGGKDPRGAAAFAYFLRITEDWRRVVAVPRQPWCRGGKRTWGSGLWCLSPHSARLAAPVDTGCWHRRPPGLCRVAPTVVPRPVAPETLTRVVQQCPWEPAINIDDTSRPFELLNFHPVGSIPHIIPLEQPPQPPGAQASL